MPDEKFDTNLMRFVAAELYFLVGMQAAKDMFDKSYCSLGLQEKAAVDQWVLSTVGGNFQTLTTEFLRDSVRQQPQGQSSPTKP
jgi:hypothetical protein